MKTLRTIADFAARIIEMDAEIGRLEKENAALRKALEEIEEILFPAT